MYQRFKDLSSAFDAQADRESKQLPALLAKGRGWRRACEPV